jgi:hypothetical protein
MVAQIPQVINNLPALLEPIGLQLFPQGIKLDASWMVDQILAMVKELLPVPETVYFPGFNHPVK